MSQFCYFSPLPCQLQRRTLFLQRHLVLAPPAIPGSLPFLFFPPSSTVSPLVPHFWAEAKPGRAAAPYRGSCEMWGEPPSGGLPGRGPHVCPAHSHPRGCPGTGSSFSIFKMALLCQDLGSALFPGPWAPSSPRGMCACTCACVSVCVCRSLPALLEPVPWLQNLNLAVMNPDHQGAHKFS